MRRVLLTLILLISLTYSFSATIVFKNHTYDMLYVRVSGYEYVCMPADYVRINVVSGERRIQVFDKDSWEMVSTTVAYIHPGETLFFDFHHDGVRYFGSCASSQAPVFVAHLHPYRSIHHCSPSCPVHYRRPSHMSHATQASPQHHPSTSRNTQEHRSTVSTRPSSSHRAPQATSASRPSSSSSHSAKVSAHGSSHATSRPSSSGTQRSSVSVRR